MKRSALILLVLVVLAAAVAGATLWRDYRAFIDGPLADGGEAVLWIRSGDTLGTVARRLQALGLAPADWHWRLYGRLAQPLIQAGEYRIQTGDTPRSLVRRLAAGDVVRHRFTIVEGWTLARLRRELADDSRVAPSTTDLADNALMARLDCPDCFAEGWFLPETYQFVRGDRDLDLLRRAHRAMRAALDEVWAERRDDLPLDTPEQLLVLASLVEMETTVDRERARVAGVFVRRLQRGMRLQTDPTVVYGLDDFDGRIRRVHLRTDHPWNTYTRSGLPPTPIGLPGEASLRAAARPADGEALYFVARGDGTHQFSRTLEEHNRAVARYILGEP
jgi:UPF0755 protein